jgi:hypothetical protein
MKKIILSFLAIVCFSFSTISVQAQAPQNAPAQLTPPKMMKPKVFAVDLVFAYQMLGSIELRASEVDALLEVKNALKPYIEQIQKDNIPLTNAVTFELSTSIAYNMIQFLERGKLIGADAEKYKRFVEGLTEAAKAIKAEENK